MGIAGQFIELPQRRQIERPVHTVNLAIAVAGAIVELFVFDDCLGH